MAQCLTVFRFFRLAAVVWVLLAMSSMMSFRHGVLALLLAPSSRPVPVKSGLFSSSSNIDSKQQENQQQKQGDRLFPEELNILYDSRCSVCRWEIDFLRRRDLAKNRGKPRLRFTDLEGPNYDDEDPANGGITYAVGMAAMRGVLPTGQMVTGVPVFRKAYHQVGLGWLFVVTKWPVFREITDLGYQIFAKYRTRLTRGGKSVPELVAIYEERQAAAKAAKTSECTGKGSCSKTVV